MTLTEDQWNAAKKLIANALYFGRPFAVTYGTETLASPDPPQHSVDWERANAEAEEILSQARARQEGIPGRPGDLTPLDRLLISAIQLATIGGTLGDLGLTVAEVKAAVDQGRKLLSAAGVNVPDAGQVIAQGTEVLTMNWAKTLLSGLKGVAATIGGIVLSQAVPALFDAVFSTQVATEIAKTPVVGGILAGLFGGLGLAARNWWAHRNDPTPAPAK